MIDEFVTFRCGVCGNTITTPVISTIQRNLDCWHYDKNGDLYISFMQPLEEE